MLLSITSVTNFRIFAVTFIFSNSVPYFVLTKCLTTAVKCPFGYLIYFETLDERAASPSNVNTSTV